MGKLIDRERKSHDGWEDSETPEAVPCRGLRFPAPDVAAVIWKKATFAKGAHRFTDTTPEQIEANEEWLAAHPTKRTKPKASK